MSADADLERLYDEHAQALFAFLLNLTRNEADTRDLLQEVFVKLAWQPDRLENVREPRAFLLRLAHNAAVDLIRRARTREKYNLEIAVESGSVFVLVSFLTLVGLFYAEEDWRGHRAWTHYARDLKARGLPVDLEDILPKQVPDDQNFVATPYWSGLRFETSQVEKRDTNRWPETLGLAENEMDRVRVESHASKPPYTRFHATDLPALEVAFQDVLTGEKKRKLDLPPPDDVPARTKAGRAILGFLKPYESVFEELQQASSRPYARFPIKYDTENPWMILLPHLAVLKRTCQALRYKGSADLAAGNSEQAAADVLLMLRLADALKEEPLLISYLVRVACVQIALGVVWEGLDFRVWSDAQLEKLAAALQRYDFLGGVKEALQGERTFGNAFYVFLRKHGIREITQAIEGPDASGSSLAISFSLAPRGWIYFEEVNHNRLFDQFLDPATPAGPQRIDPARETERQEDLEESLKGQGPFDAFLHHRVLASLLLPALSKVEQRGANAQAYVEMAVLACGLERYHLANGAYPETLAEIAPRFLGRIPNDVVSDRPYHYQRTANGRFVLYSNGWNAADEGGVEDRNSSQGDWVWSYPSK
jgi:DNA-directed RNA polymerase specialized sigma24 family protein